MVERIELKHISANTKPIGRVTPAKNAERDEKRNNFNRHLQNELDDKEKKQNNEGNKENIENKFMLKNSEDEKQLEKKKGNKEIKEPNPDSGKIDIYI